MKEPQAQKIVRTIPKIVILRPALFAGRRTYAFCRQPQ
jgi:hypothetical protein